MVPAHDLRSFQSSSDSCRVRAPFARAHAKDESDFVHQSRLAGPWECEASSHLHQTSNLFRRLTMLGRISMKCSAVASGKFTRSGSLVPSATSAGGSLIVCRQRADPKHLMLLHRPQRFAADEIQHTSFSEQVFNPLRSQVCPISRRNKDRPIL